MHCPNCGTPEKARVRVCGNCGESYASVDLQEYRQLQYLLNETATWKIPNKKLEPYSKKLETLKKRLPTDGTITTVLEPAPPVEIPKPKVEKPKEKVPFDQWLLSEKNIKTALYGGAGLLILAGLIFIGINWTRIPGPGKFAITLLITGLTYLGGFLLFQRPALKLGGNALLLIASGFLALNFAVLQIYVFGPGGLQSNIMWLIASPLCLLGYSITANWTKSELFTYIGLGAIGSTLAAALAVFASPIIVSVLAFELLFFGLMLAAKTVKGSKFKDFALKPILVVSHVGMPVGILASLSLWTEVSGNFSSYMGSPWFAIVAIALGPVFYLLTDFEYDQIVARFATSILFVATIASILTELIFSKTVIGIFMMLLSLAYLRVGLLYANRNKEQQAGMPYFSLAFLVAGIVTFMASSDVGDFINILFGDVLLLAVSAYLFKDFRWVYGSVWLVMLPTYLIIINNVNDPSNQGLLMGLLGVNFAAAGYVLGREKLERGGSFLSAAAFLTVVTVVLLRSDSLISGPVLIAIAALYLVAALWIRWQWLLLPSLVSIGLSVLAITTQYVGGTGSVLAESRIIAFAFVGTIFVGGATFLRQAKSKEWASPLFLIGTIYLGGAYLVSLTWLGWLAISLSSVLLILLLLNAWYERKAKDYKNVGKVVPYLGIVVLFIGHFLVLDQLGGSRIWNIWPSYTAGLCALLMGAAWMTRNRGLGEVFDIPLRRSGLLFFSIPLAGSVIIGPTISAVSFAIAGISISIDAYIRGLISLAYVGLGAFVAVIWAILFSFDVTEMQAFALPLGIALLGAGWYERARVEDYFYRPFTILGLLVLMGTAFFQSLPRGGSAYAFLLLVESLVALVAGIRTKSRGYVQLGGLALLGNAVVQLGPGFVELPRWVQIGLIGGILLGFGLAAMFRREQLIETRKKLTNEWKKWQS